MSQHPYLTNKDFHELKDASKFYLDYLVQTGVRRDAPELFEKARRANGRLLDFVQLWDNYPGLGDRIELRKPVREL